MNAQTTWMEKLSSILVENSSVTVPAAAIASPESATRPSVQSGMAQNRYPNAQANATPKKADDNLGYWLDQGESIDANKSTTQPTVTEPQEAENPFRRLDALPGVLQDSKGRLHPGGLYTTRDTPWKVWVPEDKVLRRIPFIAVLSITAIVTEEKLELKWRWKGMGEPERVYTGESYPSRELQWRFHLIDGSQVTGSVKGQPITVELRGKQTGPFILHERLKGPVGQKLADLVHVKKIFVSRSLMDRVLAEKAESASKPAKKP